MKILIAYYTKTGTTAKCANMLREHFPSHDVTVRDLSELETETGTETRTTLQNYDAVLLGAPIRMGHIDKRMRQLIADNHRLLLLSDKVTGFFVCCGEPEAALDIMLKDIPRDLYETAAAVGNFGGEFDLTAQKGFWAKAFVWAVRRSIRNAQRDDDIADEDKPRYPELRPDDIARFADAVKTSFWRK